MGKWNEEAAPNNNLNPADLKKSKFLGTASNQAHEFSEELADGGVRNERFNKPRYNKH